MGKEESRILLVNTGRSSGSLNTTRRKLLGFLRRNAIDEDVAAQIELAVYEAIANIIEHENVAYRNSGVRLKVEIAPPEIRIFISYRGDEFDVTGFEMPDIRAHFDSGKDGGLGIHVIRTLMDRVEYSHGSGGNELRMIKTIGPPS
jgi:anti-sigma regulatory factor (Ser/Thr protein kinase)